MITVDGVDIRQLNPLWFRTNIGTVNQVKKEQNFLTMFADPNFFKNVRGCFFAPPAFQFASCPFKAIILVLITVYEKKSVPFNLYGHLFHL